MVIKKVVKDIQNNIGDSISKNEMCELVDVWLNGIANDIYIKLKTNSGGEIITSIKSIDINS